MRRANLPKVLQPWDVTPEHQGIRSSIKVEVGIFQNQPFPLRAELG